VFFRLFDYLLLASPGFVIAIWAEWRTICGFSAGSKAPTICGCTGAEVASAILGEAGVATVAIEPAAGELSDYYDSTREVLRLSRPIYEGCSLASLGVAAHEAGHAIQDASGYRWLMIRNAVIPWATTASQLFWLLVLAGVLLEVERFVLAGLFLYSAAILLQLANLPVEFDASRRARLALTKAGLVESEEAPVLDNVMNGAGWRYVALVLTGITGLFNVGRLTRRLGPSVPISGPEDIKRD
jgi:Zn-dependent membrane protease YugP